MAPVHIDVIPRLDLERRSEQTLLAGIGQGGGGWAATC